MSGRSENAILPEGCQLLRSILWLQRIPLWLTLLTALRLAFSDLPDNKVCQAASSTQLNIPPHSDVTMQSIFIIQRPEPEARAMTALCVKLDRTSLPTVSDTTCNK